MVTINDIEDTARAGRARLLDSFKILIPNVVTFLSRAVSVD